MAFRVFFIEDDALIMVCVRSSSSSSSSSRYKWEGENDYGDDFIIRQIIHFGWAAIDRFVWTRGCEEEEEEKTQRVRTY